MASPLAANAFVDVDEWNVGMSSAPIWSTSGSNAPLAYTGQEAAALLFGGLREDYAISTVDDNPGNINNLA